MKTRIIAILDFFNESFAANVKEIWKTTHEFGTVYVFGKTETYDMSEMPDAIYVCVSSDANTEVKRRNWVNRFFRKMEYSGFAHVISGSVRIKDNPTMFIDDVETMMNVFDYHVWFNTVCDGCNYVYSKYNPRISIHLDIADIQVKTGLPTVINMTSHSNPQWIIYDYGHVSDDLLRFDEDFAIPMFWIIEFLARRRNTKPENSVYFMNYYLSVPSEVGLFENIDTAADAPNPDQMKIEDAVFKGKKINYEQDSNIDFILGTFWNKIKEKTGKNV